MVYVKIHQGLSHVVAVCDENLVGKVLKEGKFQLDVNKYFYKGVRKTKEEAKKIMENAENLNIVGKESVKIALELKIIDKGSIIKIKGVPHAQAVSC